MTDSSVRRTAYAQERIGIGIACSTLPTVEPHHLLGRCAPNILCGVPSQTMADRLGSGQRLRDVLYALRVFFTRLLDDWHHTTAHSGVRKVAPSIGIPVAADLVP